MKILKEVTEVKEKLSQLKRKLKRNVTDYCFVEIEPTDDPVICNLHFYNPQEGEGYFSITLDQFKELVEWVNSLTKIHDQELG